MIGASDSTKAELARIAKPLEKLDRKLEKFASDKGLQLAYNTRGRPNREFRWHFRLVRLIEIFLDSETKSTCTVWICAYKHGNSIRFRKKEILLDSVTVGVLDAKLEDLLEDAYEKVCSWSISELINSCNQNN